MRHYKIKRTSKYIGVTKHRWTGHYEAHFWDACYIYPSVQPKNSGRRRGKQVYIGRYTNEIDAAHAYDVVSIIKLGVLAKLNFPEANYHEECADIFAMRSLEEVIVHLRKNTIRMVPGDRLPTGLEMPTSDPNDSLHFEVGDEMWSELSDVELNDFLGESAISLPVLGEGLENNV